MSHTNKAYASTESSSCNDSDGYSNSSSEYHQNVQNEMKANGVSQNGNPNKMVGGPGWSNLQNISPMAQSKDSIPGNTVVGGLSSYSSTRSILDTPQKMTLKEMFTEYVSNENPICSWLNSSLIFILTWASLACILGQTAMPGGNIFSMVIVYGCAVIGGKLVGMVKLPPLLGMLVAGILLRSIPGVNIVGASVNRTWSSVIRSIALVVILIRAGLGLNPKKLKELSFMMFRLAIIPCLFETAAIAVTAYVLLGFPWLWGILLGFALSAVSPAVVVPGMLAASEQGLGVEKGIPTLCIAAGSVEDVFAIAGFTVMLGITLSGSSLTWQILQGPCDIAIGIVYGVVAGYLCLFLQYKPRASEVTSRFLLLLGLGLVALFGSKLIKFSGAGALGCLVMSFVVGSAWRNGGSDEKKLNQKFADLWNFIQHFVFGLIGAEIDLMGLDGTTVGLGVVTIAIGTLIRCLVSFVVVMGRDLTVKERLFVALSKIPKATVQAAIGSIALDYARKYAAGTDYAEQYELFGSQVLTISVLIILITAPLGAGVIMLTGPPLLKPEGDNKSDPESKS